jgi:hypothetical protein
VINQLFRSLNALEREMCTPILRIDEARLDHARSGIEERESLCARFVSNQDESCPFELVFARGKHIGHVSSFVGRGAYFADFETLTNSDDAVELSDDVKKFLEATIAVERAVQSHGVVSERYQILGWRDGKEALELYWGSGDRKIFRATERQKFQYLPWIAK